MSHMSQMTSETKCVAGDGIPSMRSELPHTITDRDLDREGLYTFDKLVKLAYPEDFKGVVLPRKHAHHDGGYAGALLQTVDIELRSNFDLSASIEFEFDQAMFGLALSEVTADEDGELGAELSHLQSPLVFKQNNDHFKSV